MAWGVVFAVALALYTLTLAPTVTLEWSGSMVTAADSLGVANPPGYPVWTLLAWLFQRAFGFMQFRGHPNPAWGVNFMSAFFGAASCGLVAWLVGRTSRDADHRRTVSFVGGVCSGLLLAFSPFLWSQSVIAETVTLNTFTVLIFLVLVYRGLRRPSGHDLYALSWLLGIGFLNSPTFVLMLPVYAIACAQLGSRRQAPGACGCILLGLLPLLYLPVASEQNPPINWNNARSAEGFMHLVSRGQFERLILVDLLSPSAEFFDQMTSYLRLLVPQFTLPALILGLASPGLLRAHGLRTWFLTVALTFLLYSVALTIGLNPECDLQTLFIARIQWVPSYALMALLIGLGLTHALAWTSRRGRLVFGLACIAAVVLSFAPLKAQFDPSFVKQFGASAQN